MAKIASMLPKLGGQSKQSTSGKGWNEANEIEKLAYQFFIERGCEHGHDREIYLWLTHGLRTLLKGYAHHFTPLAR